MKVSELIEMLNRNYSGDDRLVVAFWDKEWAEAELERSFTDSEWREMAEFLDDNGDNLGNQISYEMKNALRFIASETTDKDHN